MKHPFWIANSVLFLLIVAALLFIYFSRAPLPEREDIEVTATPQSTKREVLAAINITKVYEQDLFDTYQEPSTQQQITTMPLPEPPKPQVIAVPELPAPQFVDPMDVTLKGIIFVSATEGKNRAIIEDNKTKKEDVYKVGDKIDDAQLIRIFGNKVIFLRSNGQQEVLYLREQDAKLDPVYANINSWNDVVQEVAMGIYDVNYQELIHRIKNLGQFIDIIGLTTAYKQGKSIGVRVGELEKNSLGISLGLQPGDIITTINDMPTASTEDRLKIYKHVTGMKENDSIIVNITRNNQDFMLKYVIKEFKEDHAMITPAEREAQAETQKKKIMEQKYKFAPTLQEIRKHEKNLMFEKGQAPKNIDAKTRIEKKHE